MQDFQIDRVSFLTVLTPLIPRLAAKELDTLAAYLDESAAPHQPHDQSPAWEPYFDLIAALKDRENKAKPRSALKQSDCGKRKQAGSGQQADKNPSSAAKPALRK